jgi:hypothetical protein
VGDYDGDRKADLAVYNAPTSTFTYRRSSDGSIVSIQLGQHGDTPIVGDYDGDGKTDIAVFRPQISSFNVILYRSSATQQTVTVNFGDPGDSPLGARYMPAEQGSGLTYSNLAGAQQTLYENQKGVPHTDKNGRILTAFDSGSSFLPRCAVGPLANELADLAAAGFNCFVQKEAPPIGPSLAEANAAGMQMIQEFGVSPDNLNATPDCTLASNASNPICSIQAEVAQMASDPAILAWKAEDEPSACSSNCAQRQANYKGLVTAIGQVDAVHPVFAVDNTASADAAESALWTWWNTTWPIASNDDYPFTNATPETPATTTTLARSALDYQTLVDGNVAVGRATLYKTPIWIWLQTFSGTIGNFPWAMPTPSQVRAQAYTALVHGSTGIFYFMLDNFVARNAQVIGISKNPLVSYPGAHLCPPHTPPDCDLIATDYDIGVSKNLWGAVVALNAELGRLQPVILSPTANLTYQVGIQGTAVTATPIRTMLKKSSDGVYTLLVINIDNVPLNVQFTFPTRPVDLYSIDTIGSRNPWTPSGNSILDSIEGFGVRIYEFK